MIRGCSCRDLSLWQSCFAGTIPAERYSRIFNPICVPVLRRARSQTKADEAAGSSIMLFYSNWAPNCKTILLLPTFFGMPKNCRAFAIDRFAQVALGIVKVWDHLPTVLRILRENIAIFILAILQQRLHCFKLFYSYVQSFYLLLICRTTVCFSLFNQYLSNFMFIIAKS